VTGFDQVGAQDGNHHVLDVRLVEERVELAALLPIEDDTADRYDYLYQGNNQDAAALDRLLKRA
jgi:hypothetical protein